MGATSVRGSLAMAAPPWRCRIMGHPPAGGVPTGLKTHAPSCSPSRMRTDVTSLVTGYGPSTAGMAGLPHGPAAPAGAGTSAMPPVTRLTITARRPQALPLAFTMMPPPQLAGCLGRYRASGPAGTCVLTIPADLGCRFPRGQAGPGRVETRREVDRRRVAPGPDTPRRSLPHVVRHGDRPRAPSGQGGDAGRRGVGRVRGHGGAAVL